MNLIQSHQDCSLHSSSYTRFVHLISGWLHLSIAWKFWSLVHMILKCNLHCVFYFQVMHKVEVFYVLCLFLTGKHKLLVSQVKKNTFHWICIIMDNCSTRNNNSTIHYFVVIIHSFLTNFVTLRSVLGTVFESCLITWRYQDLLFSYSNLYLLFWFYCLPVIFIYCFDFCTGSEEALRVKIDSWNEPVIWQDVMAKWNRKNVSVVGKVVSNQHY